MNLSPQESAAVQSSQSLRTRLRLAFVDVMETRLVGDIHNPYYPSTAPVETASYDLTMIWFRCVYPAHLLVIVATFFFVRHNEIGQYTRLEWLVVVRLFLALFAFPALTVIAAMASTNQNKLLRCTAVLADIGLSVIHLCVWPAVQ